MRHRDDLKPFLRTSKEQYRKCGQWKRRSTERRTRIWSRVVVNKFAISMAIFLETLMESRRVRKGRIYSVLTFEPLHSIFTGISKCVTECTESYSSSDRLRTGKAQRKGNSFVKIRVRVLQGCSMLLIAIEGDGEFS